MTTVAGLDFDALSEEQVVARITADLAEGRGGWVVTPNIDICRRVGKDPAARDLVRGASLVVADGMPLVWAARLRGDPLPERVTGSSLIFTLTAAAAGHGRSVYLLGGEPGVPEQAAAALTRRFPGLRVAGTDAPPAGFDVAEAAGGWPPPGPTSCSWASASPSRSGSSRPSPRACRAPGSSAAAPRSRSRPARCRARRGGCSKPGWSGRTAC